METDGRRAGHLEFSPLPESGRPPRPPHGKNSEISGSEQVVGLGALCDFFHPPMVGDRTVHFSVTEYCELDNGQRAELRDLGFNLSTTLHTGNKPPDPDPTEGLTIEFLIEEVLQCTGPEVRLDGSTSEEEHDWEELALCVQNTGLKVTGEELRALGYSIAFTDRVKQQITHA